MKNDKDALKIRIIFVSVIFVLFYGVIFSRAFQLQIIEGESLEEKAGRQHVRTHTVPSKRGAILDRNLNELAVSLEVDSIFAHPREMEDNSIDKVSVAKILSEVLPVKKSILSKSLSSKKGFVWL
ncbi:MAG: penicillin-binding protein, partial [Deltaproteobacteria bacterium]|nr:penicillin-binding protein [Deltaproteobacteria bacterium]